MSNVFYLCVCALLVVVEQHRLSPGVVVLRVKVLRVGTLSIFLLVSVGSIPEVFREHWAAILLWHFSIVELCHPLFCSAAVLSLLFCDSLVQCPVQGAQVDDRPPGGAQVLDSQVLAIVLRLELLKGRKLRWRRCRWALRPFHADAEAVGARPWLRSSRRQSFWWFQQRLCTCSWNQFELGRLVLHWLRLP